MAADIRVHPLCCRRPIYGNAIGEIDFPASLFYGMGIGGMFVVIALISAANVFLLVMFIVNTLLETNFLYIMYAPEGSVIAKLDVLFGWPGYVAVMDALAIALIMSMYMIHRAVFRKELTSVNIYDNIHV